MNMTVEATMLHMKSILFWNNLEFYLTHNMYKRILSEIQYYEYCCAINVSIFVSIL